MNLTASYGLLAYALIFAALCTTIRFGIFHARAGLFATLAALAVGIAPGLNGIFGLPSGTLLLLAITHLAYPHYKYPQLVQIKFWALVSFTVFAILFYLLYLQIINSDISVALNLYNFGYANNSVAMLLVLLFSGIILYYYKNYDFWVICILFDVILWKVGVYNNLWDALFCVPLLVFALLILIKEVFIKIKVAKLIKNEYRK